MASVRDANSLLLACKQVLTPLGTSVTSLNHSHREMKVFTQCAQKKRLPIFANTTKNLLLLIVRFSKN